ncbi:DUF4183 domain-containing protein [Gorillibacterium sp. sgz5001074]|uniref:DUF4183 domain-containing protein n=1 Tax=Gorillibacterium sp. sgz5001074 TaxID=3446695 RepID=UPI003F674561
MAITANVFRYLFIPGTDLDLSGPVAIPAASFIGDLDQPVTLFVEPGDSGYYNLFLNGQIQLGGTFTVTPNELLLHSDGGTLYAGTPVSLEGVQISAQVIT